MNSNADAIVVIASRWHRWTVLRAVSLAVAMIAAIGCGKEPSDNPPAPADETRSGPAAHPDGPCAELRDSRCIRRDPKFTAASGAAVVANLSAGPVDSGQLSDTRLYAIRVELRRGQRVRLDLSLLSSDVRLSVRRWWPAADGWGHANDSFSSVEPGATWELSWDAEEDAQQLIAVEAEHSTSFRAVLSETDSPAPPTD